MEDPLSRWMDLGMKELIQHSKAPHTLDVMWFNAPSTELFGLCNILGIRGRQLHITTIDDWRKLAITCLTVHYHDQKDKDANWFDLGARSYTIKKWSLKQPIKRQGQFTNNAITSVYDTVRKKRILIDGNKRATVLTTEDQSQTKPDIDILIYEWYGKHVNMIFPCDFCQLYRTSPDTGKTNARTATIV
jgi:hypothetical protein